MRFQALVLTAVILALSGCASAPSPAPEVQRTCAFHFDSDVDGVWIAGASGRSETSKAGGSITFDLPCVEQRFSLSKPCFEAKQLVLAPEDVHNLERSEWEKYGYLRVENDSSSEPLEIGGLPGKSLEVASHEHGVRKLPAGDYVLEVAAPYKVPVTHEIWLCADDEIFSLRVQTEGPEGQLVAQGAQELTLEHGVGSLRVVTELPNVEFRIEPQDSDGLWGYLQQVGIKDLSGMDLQELPEAVRKTAEIVRRMRAEVYKAPIAVVLPAGAYTVTMVGDRVQGSKVAPREQTVRVQPDEEAQIHIPQPPVVP